MELLPFGNQFGRFARLAQGGPCDLLDMTQLKFALASNMLCAGVKQQAW